MEGFEPNLGQQLGLRGQIKAELEPNLKFDHNNWIKFGPTQPKPDLPLPSFDPAVSWSDPTLAKNPV